jgi:hypothetical protein
MLYKKIIAVCSQIHTKYINTPLMPNLIVHIVTKRIYMGETFALYIFTEDI